MQNIHRYIEIHGFPLLDRSGHFEEKETKIRRGTHWKKMNSSTRGASNRNNGKYSYLKSFPFSIEIS